MVETNFEKQPPEYGPPERDWLTNIFVGPKGIRAGWSALIFLALLFVFTIAGGIALFPFLISKSLPAMAVGEGLTLAAVLSATGVMALIERKSFRTYGYADAKKGRHGLAGLAFGFAAFSLLIGLIFASGHLRLGPAEGAPPALLAWAGTWGLMFVLVALTEESLFRGYLQATFARGMGSWGAAMLMSLMFGISHATNGGENPMGLVGVGLAGLMFVLFLRVTGSLWFPIGFHAAWDWAETYFYGAPDSGVPSKGHLFSYHAFGGTLWTGGSAGPEGSVWALVVAAIGIGVCLVLLRRR